MKIEVSTKNSSIYGKDYKKQHRITGEIVKGVILPFFAMEVVILLSINNPSLLPWIFLPIGISIGIQEKEDIKKGLKKLLKKLLKKIKNSKQENQNNSIKTENKPLQMQVQEYKPSLHNNHCSFSLPQYLKTTESKKYSSQKQETDNSGVRAKKYTLVKDGNNRWLRK